MLKTLTYQVEVDEKLYDLLMGEIDKLVKSTIIPIANNEKFTLVYDTEKNMYVLTPNKKPDSTKVKFSTPRFKLQKYFVILNSQLSS